jgi:hypothetical protein
MTSSCWNFCLCCEQVRRGKGWQHLDLFGEFLDTTPQSRQSAKRFSSRWNWDSPTPLAAGQCAPPPHPLVRGGGHTRLRLKGWGSHNSNKGTYTVVLYIYKYSVYHTQEGQDHIGRSHQIVLSFLSIGSAPIYCFIFSVHWERTNLLFYLFCPLEAHQSIFLSFLSLGRARGWQHLHLFHGTRVP